MELLEDISVQVVAIQIAVFDQWSWSYQLSYEQKEARLPGWMQGQGSARFDRSIYLVLRPANQAITLDRGGVM